MLIAAARAGAGRYAAGPGSSDHCVGMDVVIKPRTILYLSAHLHRRARPLVVQEAFEQTWCWPGRTFVIHTTQSSGLHPPPERDDDLLAPPW